MAVTAVLLLLMVGADVATAAELPLGEWHFDQVSGGSLTADSSGHGNALEVTGASLVPGRFANALAFEAGEDARLGEAQSIGLLEPARVTAMAWVKKTTAAPGNFKYVIGKGAKACTGASFGLYTGAGGGMQFYVNDGATIHQSPAAPAAAIWDGNWHAVAGSYDGTAVRLYVDGAEVGSGTATANSIAYELTDRELTVGDYAQSACGNGISAAIDEPRIYGRALSASEVATLQNPAATSPPELGEGGGGGGGGAAASASAKVVAQAGGKLKFGASEVGSKLGAWLSAKASTPSPGAHMLSFHWDLDSDGKTDVTCPAEAPSLFHQFGSGGNHPITVIAEDSAGQTATTSTVLHFLGHFGSPRPARPGTGATASKAKKQVKKAPAQVSACITQYEEQRPSTKDCVRSFQFGVIDVNARSDNCFTLKGEPPSTERAGARAGASSAIGQPLHRFFDASVKGSVALNGLPIPLPNSFTSTYSSVTGRIGLGTREIGFDLGGDHVKIASLDLTRSIEGTYYHHGLRTLDLGAVNLAGLGDIGGFATGKARLSFVEPGRTELDVDLKLPSAFTMPDGGPAVAQLEAFAENTRPFHVDHFHLHVPYVWLGPVLGKDLDLDYLEQGEVWTGGAAFLLPGMEPPFELDASPKPGTDYGVQFAAGALRHAGAEVDFGALAPQIFPGVFLSNLRFTFGTDPVRVFGGGTLNTAKIVYVDGDILTVFPEDGESYVVPAGLQGFQRLAGRRLDSLSLAGGGDVFFKIGGFDLPLGNAFLLYTYPGRFEFSGAVDVPLGVFSAKGEASGFLDARSRAFNAEGHGDFCVLELDACLGADMLVSSDGIAGCGRLGSGVFSVAAGAGYHWGRSFHIYFWGCDVGPYRVNASSSSASASAAGSRRVELPPGLPFAALELKGAGGAPDVTLHGPKGETLSTSGRLEGQEGKLAFMRVNANQTAYVGIKEPSAGTWTVTANPGSPAIESLASANGQEPPSVDASVDGHGATRTIHYRVEQRPGQKVVFAELGEDTYHEIGTAKGLKGSLRFTPRFGSAGRRQLFALVEREGVVTEKLKVAKFKSPGARPPRLPKGLKVSRKGGVVRASWKPQPGVRRYAVTVRTADGVPHLVVVKKASAKLKGIPKVMAGTVSVAGIDALGGGYGPDRKVGFKAASSH